VSSELLIADAAATRTDVFVTVGVLIGVLFSRKGYLWVDPVVAIAVAIPHGARRLPDFRAHRACAGRRASHPGADHPADRAGRRGREERLRYPVARRERGVRYAEVTIAWIRRRMWPTRTRLPMRSKNV